MATAKQKAWRAKFARLYGRKKKRKTSKRPKTRKTRIRRSRPMARRRRSYRKRRFGARKKYFSLSLLDIGQLAMQYSNLTGEPLGALLDKLTGAILNNQGDIFDILMSQIMTVVGNVTDRPFEIAAKGALIAGFFAIVRSFAGRKKILAIGKFRITV